MKASTDWVAWTAWNQLDLLAELSVKQNCSRTISNFLVVYYARSIAECTTLRISVSRRCVMMTGPRCTAQLLPRSCNCRSWISLAIGAAVLIAATIGMRTASAAPSCYDSGELLAIGVTNYFFAQSLMSLKCDQIAEGNTRPTVKEFQTLNAAISARHKNNIERFTKPLKSYATRVGVTYDQLLMQMGQQNYSAVMARLDDNSSCDVFRGDLERRKEWSYVISQLMIELSGPKVPICKE